MEEFRQGDRILININIVLDEGAYLPTRGHVADAGLDLMTPIDFIVPKGGCYTIDTGVHMEIPMGWWGKLESKSGLNIKHDVVSLGGTIDSGYTGSIRVKLYNFGNSDYEFKKGEKVVQIIIAPCEYPILHLVNGLSETDRGESGFGSTGK